MNAACPMSSSTWSLNHALRYQLRDAVCNPSPHGSGLHRGRSTERILAASLLCRYKSTSSYSSGGLWSWREAALRAQQPEHPLQNRRNHHRRKSGNCDYLVRSGLVTSNLPDAPCEIPEAAWLVVCHDKTLSIDSHVWQWCLCSLLL